MSRWKVDWEMSALNELAAIWTDAADRNPVTEAVRRIDQRLSRNPATEGRHLAEGLFSLDAMALRAFYWFDSQRGTVEVVGVHRLIDGSSSTSEHQ